MASGAFKPRLIDVIYVSTHHPILRFKTNKNCAPKSTSLYALELNITDEVKHVHSASTTLPYVHNRVKNLTSSFQVIEKQLFI